MCKYFCCCRCRFVLILLSVSSFVWILFNSYSAFWTIFGLPSECVACCCCSILSSCILFSIFSLFWFGLGRKFQPLSITKERTKNKEAEKSYEFVELGVCVRAYEGCMTFQIICMSRFFLVSFQRGWHLFVHTVCLLRFFHSLQVEVSRLLLLSREFSFDAQR